MMKKIFALLFLLSSLPVMASLVPTKLPPQIKPDEKLSIEKDLLGK